jgi:hypothetical protein
MPGTVFAASGSINWYEASIPQRSFVHCFQQGSPSVPSGSESFSLNHASNGPAYINQSGVPYYINRNHYAASGGSGRQWAASISANNHVSWSLAYDYQHWPNTQEYQINLQNNNPNDYLVDFWISDLFGNNQRYENPVVAGAGGNYYVGLNSTRLNFTSVAANSDYLLYIVVTDVTNLGPPGLVDVIIDDADGYAGTLYNSPGNTVPPGGTWDNAGAPANLSYWIAHNYNITIF